MYSIFFCKIPTANSKRARERKRRFRESKFTLVESVCCRFLCPTPQPNKCLLLYFSGLCIKNERWVMAGMEEMLKNQTKIKMAFVHFSRSSLSDEAPQLYKTIAELILITFILSQFPISNCLNILFNLAYYK